MPIVFSIIGAIRRHPWRSLLILLIILIVGLPVYALTRPTQPTYVTDVSKKGDLVQTVEAVGTVTSDRNLKLQFATTGIVGSVPVTEGQRVYAGQTLAGLRAAEIAASIASQDANVAYLQAQYRQVLEGVREEEVSIARAQLESAKAGSRPEDLAIAQADVTSKQAQLDAARATLGTAEASLTAANAHLAILKQQQDTAMQGLVLTGRSTIDQQLVTAENALFVVRGIFDDVKIQDAILKQRPEADASLRNAINDQRAAIVTARTKVNAATDTETALQAFLDARTQVAAVASTVGQAHDVVSSLEETPYLTNSVKEGHKVTLATQRSAAQTALSTLDGAFKALQDASASYATQIATERSTIVSATGTRDRARAEIGTYEAALRASMAQLALKKAGPRPEDIAVSEAQLKAKQAGPRRPEVDAAAARVRQAQAEAARVRAQYANTVLTSPVNGVVTKVNVKVGEALPVGPAVEVLGDTPFRIEMFVAEVDISKVSLGQNATIELDAFPGITYKLKVSQVDPGPTVVSGVSKYRILLEFVYPHTELKLGMTGNTPIVSGERKDVVFVPRRAVIENAKKETIVRVLRADNAVEERPVTIGMEGGSGDVEIVTGLKAGETVVVLTKS